MLMEMFGASQCPVKSREQAEHAVLGGMHQLEAAQAHQQAEKVVFSATEAQVLQLASANAIQQALNAMHAAEEALTHAPSKKLSITWALHK